MIRKHLDEAALAAATEAGRKLSVDDAVAMALDEGLASPAASPVGEKA
jgi:hypothetical protein